MKLQFSPVPEFHVCDLKHFEKTERHVTRIMADSVLILMLSGTLSFRENGEELLITEGEYYIQRGGLLQEGSLCCPDAVYYYIHFEGAFSEESGGLGLHGRYNAKNLLPMLERLKASSDTGGADLFRLNAQMLRIFSELLAQGPRYDESESVAYRLKNYLDTQYAQRISLEELSHDFGYTKDYLIRIFKDRYGIPPHQYLIRRRMDQARWLLEGSALSTEQVSAAVGYADFSAFYRAFCKTHGCSPKSIRKG